MIPEAEAGARLTIDLAAIAANWRALARRAPGAECGAAVKADAYGLGIAATVPALRKAGCRTFFVAFPGEGAAVRAAAPDAVVYVLNGLVAGRGEAYAAHDLRPVLGSLEEIAEWSAFQHATGWGGGAALHVDTGMTRLGLRLEEALAHAAALPPFSLVMSHFACADQPAHPLNTRQIAAFRQVRAAFPGTPASLCNSSGLFLPDDLGFDLVRPGIALYGGNPTPGRPNPMAPVVRLEARVIAVRTARAGECVGYGATWTCRAPGRFAIVGVGYADGFLRAGSSADDRDGALARVAGHPCRVAGRISMDLTAIDVGALPEDAVRRGDWVELIGDGLGIDEVGRRAGTIGYEVLTSLGRRYNKRVTGG